MTPRKVGLVKADLRKPLPAGMTTARKVALLNARIAKTHSTKSLTTSKRPGRSFVRTGGVGTNMAEAKMGDILRLSFGTSTRSRLAAAADTIYNALRAGSIELPVSEHQALVRSVNKIRKSSTLPGAKPLTLTRDEANNLKNFYFQVTRRELEF